MCLVAASSCLRQYLLQERARLRYRYARWQDARVRHRWLRRQRKFLHDLNDAPDPSCRSALSDGCGKLSLSDTSCKVSPAECHLRQPPTLRLSADEFPKTKVLSAEDLCDCPPLKHNGYTKSSGRTPAKENLSWWMQGPRMMKVWISGESRKKEIDHGNEGEEMKVMFVPANPSLEGNKTYVKLQSSSEATADSTSVNSNYDLSQCVNDEELSSHLYDTSKVISTIDKELQNESTNQTTCTMCCNDVGKTPIIISPSLSSCCAGPLLYAGPSAEWNFNREQPSAWNQNIDPSNNWNDNIRSSPEWNGNSEISPFANHCPEASPNWNVDPSQNWSQSLESSSDWNQTLPPPDEWNSIDSPSNDICHQCQASTETCAHNFVLPATSGGYSEPVTYLQSTIHTSNNLNISDPTETDKYPTYHSNESTRTISNLNSLPRSQATSSSAETSPYSNINQTLTTQSDDAAQNSPTLPHYSTTLLSSNPFLPAPSPRPHTSHEGAFPNVSEESEMKLCNSEIFSNKDKFSLYDNLNMMQCSDSCNQRTTGLSIVNENEPIYSECNFPTVIEEEEDVSDSMNEDEVSLFNNGS